MEHTVLHAIQLTGLLLALSGPLFVLCLIRPAARAMLLTERAQSLFPQLEERAARFVCIGALAAAAGGAADLFVQTAELTGSTVFGRISWEDLQEFVTETHAGRMAVGRVLLLAGIAVVARRAGRGRWWLLAALGAVTVSLSALVSHAAARPAGAALAVAGQVSHLVGIAVWMGMLLHLAWGWPVLHQAGQSEAAWVTAQLTRRFSPWAFGAVAVIGLTGISATARSIPSAVVLFTSPYGLSLLVKLGLLSLVAWAGYTNYSVRLPALRHVCGEGASAVLGKTLDAPSSALAVERFRRTLELEVTAGLLVIAVAGVVGSVAPPAGPGRQQLTVEQTAALLHPHGPRTHLPDPATFCGAPERTREDLEYAEFTHNWSGVIVTLLGCCWLVQSTSGRWGGAAARLWPWLLVPFGLFISFISDPEVWWLRSVSVKDVLADPQMLEHQLGAVMVFVLAWFGWRDRLRPVREQPLGPVLPAIMIVGSLLLLGHAHSNLNASEPLISLINAQHAIMGGCGLFAGTLRWLGLRQLIPERLSAWTWPGFVVLLGLFMALCYREVV